MIPIIGLSNNRVTPVEDDNFGGWVHAHNFRAIKSAANVQNSGSGTNNDANQRQTPFAVLLKHAEQDNDRPNQRVELRPRQQATFNLLDIEA